MSGPHPELEPDPFDDDAPMPGQRRRRALRIVVLVALGALVLPLVLSAYGVAKSAADRACAVFVSAYDTNAAGFRTTFDLFAPGGAGWECFAISDERRVAAARQPRAAPGDAAAARTRRARRAQRLTRHAGVARRAVARLLRRHATSAVRRRARGTARRCRAAARIGSAVGTNTRLYFRPSGSSTVRASSCPRFTRW